MNNDCEYDCEIKGKLHKVLYAYKAWFFLVFIHTKKKPRRVFPNREEKFQIGKEYLKLHAFQAKIYSPVILLK